MRTPRDPAVWVCPTDAKESRGFSASVADRHALACVCKSEDDARSWSGARSCPSSHLCHFTSFQSSSFRQSQLPLENLSLSSHDVNKPLPYLYRASHFKCHTFNTPLWPIYHLHPTRCATSLSPQDDLHLARVVDLHNTQDLHVPTTASTSKNLTILSQTPRRLPPVSGVSVLVAVFDLPGVTMGRDKTHFVSDRLLAAVHRQEQEHGLPHYALAEPRLLREQLIEQLPADAEKWGRSMRSPMACLLDLVTDDHMIPCSLMLLGFTVNILYIVALRAGLHQTKTHCLVSPHGTQLQTPVVVKAQLDIILCRILVEFQRNFDNFWHQVTKAKARRKADWGLLFCTISSFACVYSAILEDMLDQAKHNPEMLNLYVNFYNSAEITMSKLLNAFCEWRNSFPDSDFTLIRHSSTQTLVRLAEAHNSNICSAGEFRWVDLMLSETAKSYEAQPLMTLESAELMPQVNRRVN
ncbi:hypothetical protein BROUX41_002394 [Berkeleyomyces rouxiae]|uniref:uncharacterized protein n=1 Tax=Berkeleyomyces rouxiae TaxID=2035830 RepID=UPI003B7A7E64